MRRLKRWLSDARGQATVEYVGLAVAVALLLAAVGGGLAGQGDKISSAMAKRLTDAVKVAQQ